MGLRGCRELSRAVALLVGDALDDSARADTHARERDWYSVRAAEECVGCLRAFYGMLRVSSGVSGCSRSISFPRAAGSTPPRRYPEIRAATGPPRPPPAAASLPELIEKRKVPRKTFLHTY